MMTIARNGLACHQATVERVESLEKSLSEANRWDADKRFLESLKRNLRETKKKLIASENNVKMLGIRLNCVQVDKAALAKVAEDYKARIDWLTGLVPQASPKWKMHLEIEIEETKKKLFASKNNVKMLSKDLDRVIAARAALKALNADNKLLLDLQKRLIEKQDKSINELKSLSGHFHQDISNYKAAIKNYRDDIDRLWKKNENHRKEIDRLTKLLSEPRPDWRDHTIKTQEIRLKELSDLIGELRRGLAKQKARNNSSDCGTCSGIIEEDLKKCRETIHNLEQQAVAAEMLAANYLDGATEKIEGQSEFIHKLQRESDTTYREKENLLTRLSSKDRRIKRLKAALLNFGFVYEEKN